MFTDYKAKNIDPDVSKQVFTALLANSPAAGAASVVYDYCVRSRVSPLFVLGIFWHESQFGTKGWAVKTRSWGNTRLPSYGAMNIGAYNQDTGLFYTPLQQRPSGRYLAAYADWVAGGISTVARLVEHAPYANAEHVRDILTIWAPPTDSNNTELYISTVLQYIESHYTPGFPGVIMPAGNVVIASTDFEGQLKAVTRVLIEGVNDSGTRYQHVWRVDGIQPWTKEG